MAYLNTISLLDSQTGKTSKIFPINEIKVASIKRLYGSNFPSTTIDTFKSTITVSGSGTVSSSGGVAVLSTGNTANSQTSISSSKKIRYTTGRTNVMSAMGSFATASTANNIKRIGIYNVNDGWFFQLSGSTFSVVTRFSGSADNIINSGNFIGNAGSTYTLDTNYHEFEIQYTSGISYFLIDNVLIHRIEYGANLQTIPMSITFQAENNNINGGTTATHLFLRDVTVSQVGDAESEADWYSVNAVAETRTLKRGVGELQKVLVTKLGAGGVTMTIYDSLTASGTIMATIDTTIGPVMYDFGIPFQNGLTYITSGAGSGNITITWD